MVLSVGFKKVPRTKKKKGLFAKNSPKCLYFGLFKAGLFAQEGGVCTQRKHCPSKKTKRAKLGKPNQIFRIAGRFLYIFLQKPFQVYRPWEGIYGSKKVFFCSFFGEGAFAYPMGRVYYSTLKYPSKKRMGGDLFFVGKFPNVKKIFFSNHCGPLCNFWGGRG